MEAGWGQAGAGPAAIQPTPPSTPTLLPAVVVAAEGFYTRALLKEGTPGRPSTVAAAGGAGAALASAVLVSAGGPAAGAGLALGAASSLALLVNYVKRALDVPGDPRAWPGPKVRGGEMGGGGEEGDPSRRPALARRLRPPQTTPCL